MKFVWDIISKNLKGKLEDKVLKDVIAEAPQQAVVYRGAPKVRHMVLFCFTQNPVLLWGANVDNLSSVKEIMQILIAHSFPFSPFFFYI